MGGADPVARRADRSRSAARLRWMDWRAAHAAHRPIDPIVLDKRDECLYFGPMSSDTLSRADQRRGFGLPSSRNGRRLEQ